ncbi:predicted protein [Uncinocarpus reesii 1704]|uniref:Uncharacterized protein n=1 Tax=Uncinocarpus reesii (strain UAMH 1704) TaxID=336963 RepID=C4JEL0_UNCRE|nr:uncharacterized protein UREG_00849 [Uncinocarpus reesii 1704]EEP76002.1 predicted protein [Uncinocarpus reesii 1704]
MSPSSAGIVAGFSVSSHAGARLSASSPRESPLSSSLSLGPERLAQPSRLAWLIHLQTSSSILLEGCYDDDSHHAIPGWALENGVLSHLLLIFRAVNIALVLASMLPLETQGV